MKSIKKGIKIKLNHVLVFIFISILLIILVLNFYLSQRFKVGEFVYNKEKGIGEIKGISPPWSYAIEWGDGSISKEKISKIKKLKELKKEEIEEIKKALSKKTSYFKDYEYNNYQEKLAYFEKSKKKGIVFGALSGGVVMGNAFLPNSVGEGNFIVKIGKGNCSANYICKNWSECEASYDIENSFSVEKNITHGLQFRYCVDVNGCLTNFLDVKECEIESPIIIKKVIYGNREFLEIFDKNESLISRIEVEGKEKGKKLNIQMFFSKKEYKPYCFDGIKNFDEDGIDCVNKGDSCPPCTSKVLYKKNFLIRVIFILIIIIFFTTLFIYLKFLRRRLL